MSEADSDSGTDCRESDEQLASQPRHAYRLQTTGYVDTVWDYKVKFKNRIP